MSEYATSSPEFISAVDALPETFATRLDDESLYVVRTAFQAGEWGEGLEELVVRLAHRESVVTSAERDQLAALYGTAGLSADLLDELTIEDVSRGFPP
ncbi:MAG: hypothetical protein GEV10_01040 [Streptosporangiales bacterium]|nr:hypothetical protein [Streptosporangiales bacterium]